MENNLVQKQEIYQIVSIKELIRRFEEEDPCRGETVLQQTLHIQSYKMNYVNEHYNMNTQASSLIDIAST